MTILFCISCLATSLLSQVDDRTTRNPMAIRYGNSTSFDGYNSDFQSIMLADSTVVIGYQHYNTNDLYLRAGKIQNGLIDWGAEQYIITQAFTDTYSLEYVSGNICALSYTIRVSLDDQSVIRTIAVDTESLVFTPNPENNLFFNSLEYIGHTDIEKMSDNRYIAVISADYYARARTLTIDPVTGAISVDNGVTIIAPDSEYAGTHLLTRLNDHQFILSYSDNNHIGYLRILEVWGSTISTGNPFELSECIDIVTQRLTDSDFVVAYRNGNAAYIQPGSIEGNEISFGDTFQTSSMFSFDLISLSESRFIFTTGCIRTYMGYFNEGQITFGPENHSQSFSTTFFTLLPETDSSFYMIGMLSLEDIVYSVRGTLYTPQPMTYVGTTVTQNTNKVVLGAPNQQIIGIEVETSGHEDPLNVSRIRVGPYGTYVTDSIHNMRMYYTGNDPNFAPINQFGSTIATPSYDWHDINGSQDLSNGMNYFWLTFDISEDASPGWWVDASCNGVTIDGTLHSITNMSPLGNRVIEIFDGTASSCLEFNGVDEMVEIDDSPSLEMGDSFTVAAWIHPDDLNSQYGIFSTRAIDQPGSFQLEVGTANGGTNRFAVSGVDTWIAVTDDNAILPGVWNHIACSRSGGEAGETILYVNGILMSRSVDTAYDILDNSDPIRIASGTNGGQFFPGKIDETSLWNRALSGEEIREIVHNGYLSYKDGLVSRWQFNDSDVDLLNNNDCELVNMDSSNWVTSTIPLGEGNVYSTCEQLGEVDLGGCEVVMNYSLTSGDSVTVTRLETAPNQYPAEIDLGGEVVGDYYWVIQKDAENPYTADIEFYTGSASLPTSNHQYYKLFRRDVWSDGEWEFIAIASSFDYNDHWIGFSDVDQTGQYIICGVPLPDPVSSWPEQNDPDASWGGIFRLEFPSPVQAGTGTLRVYDASDICTGSVNVADAYFFDNYVVFDLQTTLEETRQYTIEIDSGSLVDGYGASWSGFTGDSWQFTTGSMTSDAGYCVEFDGVDDYINLGHNPILDLTEGITLECWVKPDEQTDWARIFSAPGSFAGKYGLSLSNVEGKVEACYCIDGGTSVFRRSYYPDITLNQWNHIAFAADNAGNGSLYINGVKMAAGSNSSFSFMGENLIIGAKQNNDYRFNGCLDEVRIWDYPRTQAQIAENMCIPIDPQSPGLKCYLQMNEGAGDITADIMGGNDGTLCNMSRSGWQESTIPCADGSFQRIDIGETDTYFFDQTDIELDITSFVVMADDTLEVYCNRLDGAPNLLPENVDSVFDSRYWAIETWGDQLYETDITFHVGDEVTSSDEATPEILALYKRGFGSDGDWSFHSRAIDASSADSTVTFTGVTALSQFIIARNTDFPSPEGTPGQCLAFDGENDYIELANEEAYDFTTQFTLECWFRPDSTDSSSYGSLIAKDWTILYMSDTMMTDFYFVGSFCDFIEYSDEMNVYYNRWNHIAVTYEFSPETRIGTLSLYLNGDLVTTGAGRDIVQNSALPVLIGLDNSSYPEYFQGQIDQVRFWSVCRTEQEIREHMYNSVLGLESGLTAIFQMNEGTGMIVTDAINDMAGTMTNMDESDWLTSTIPYGAGFSTSGVETTGVVDFTGTDLSIEFNTGSGAEITVSRIDTQSNIEPMEPNEVIGQHYWVVNRYGSGDCNADLTFTLNDLTIEDESNPDQIALFTRACNSDEAWVYLSSASEINATTNEATFDGVEELGQFIIARWIQSIDPPQNLTIQVVGDDVRISWDDVGYANSYRVFCCDTMNGTYIDVTDSGVFATDTRILVKREGDLNRRFSCKTLSNTRLRTRTTWSMPVNGERKFFYVTSSTEPTE